MSHLTCARILRRIAKLVAFLATVFFSKCGILSFQPLLFYLTPKINGIDKRLAWKGDNENRKRTVSNFIHC